MRLKLAGLLLINVLTACHNDGSSSSNPPPAVASSPTTQPVPTLVSGTEIDSTAPSVLRVYQVENELTVAIVFSEPMHNYVRFSAAVSNYLWNENKTELRVFFQKDQNLTESMDLVITELRDVTSSRQ